MLMSIIIPVYNVEKYLKECVNSILKQDFFDYEIILVDDGSKDSSGEICDEYAKNIDNITVIHKENGGLSDARNVGLKAAKGEYILFIDSDDYIGDGALSRMSQCINEFGVVDVVFLEAKKVFPDGTCVSLGDGFLADEINGKSKSEVMKHIATRPKYPGSACTKMIKKSVIFDNDLLFEKGLLSEDIDWTIKLLTKANTFSYCNADYYYYRQNRQGSITNTANLKNLECLLYIIKKWASKDFNKEYQKEINAFMAYEYMILLLGYSRLSKESKKILNESLKEYKWVLKYAQSKNVWITAAVSSILGINITASLLKKIHSR